MAAQFDSLQLANGNYTALMEAFTPNTYIMVIMHDKSIRKRDIAQWEGTRHLGLLWLGV